VRHLREEHLERPSLDTIVQKHSREPTTRTNIRGPSNPYHEILEKMRGGHEGTDTSDIDSDPERIHNTSTPYENQ
jgi:hypothetical protein